MFTLFSILGLLGLIALLAEEFIGEKENESH